MKLSTETTLIIPQDVVYFDMFSVGLERDGVVIKAKAPLFADWIKGTQSVKTASGKPKLYREIGPWDQSSECFLVPDHSWQETKSYGFAPTGGQGSWFWNDRPNLVWLFHVDLGTGMEIKVKQPISLNNWEDYFTACCSTITSIYTQELRQALAEAKFIEKVG